MSKIVTKWISDLAVTTIKIADGAINNAKVAADAAIVESKLSLDYSTSSLNTAIGTVSSNLSSHVGDTNNPHSVTKTQVGLGNVDNVQQIPLSEKGAASGVATLDSNGKLTNAQIPAIAITDTFVVASEAAMLLLVCEKGDVAVRTDLNKSFILKGTDPTVLADWQELLTPTDSVLSVNGQTGAVSLDADDIDDTSTTNKFVTAGDLTKLGHISVTQAVDLDTMESDISSNASAISNHISDASGAHAASAISFSNVASGLVATDAQAAIDEVEGRLDTAEGSLSSHISNTSNPHSVTKAQVGLTNVDDVQQLPMSYLDTDGTMAANSDIKVPSQKAVVTYVAAQISAIPAAAAPREEILTLVAQDITNGYIDLAMQASSDASISVTPKNGPMQEKGVDYTLSVVSNKTRITFAGDLLALAADDKLIVRYHA